MTTSQSTAPFHVFGEEMPMPMRGASFLIEIEYETIESSILLLSSETQLNVATVRAASPLVPRAVLDAVLPGGNGSVGRRVIAGDNQFELLTAADYELFGLEEPTDENGLRLLGFVNLNRITGYLPTDGQAVPASAGFLPFVPFGERVFLAFDKSDVAPLFKEGEINDEAVEQTESGLYVPEQAVAAQNNIATVIGMGPEAEGVSVGDRVVAPKQEASLEYEGETYFYVPRPSSLVCKVGRNEHLARGEVSQFYVLHNPYVDRLDDDETGDGSSLEADLVAAGFALAASKYAEGDALAAVDCPTPDLCRSVGCQEECLAANEDVFTDPVTGLSAADFVADGAGELRLGGEDRYTLAELSAHAEVSYDLSHGGRLVVRDGDDVLAVVEDGVLTVNDVFDDRVVGRDLDAGANDDGGTDAE